MDGLLPLFLLLLPYHNKGMNTKKKKNHLKCLQIQFCTIKQWSEERLSLTRYATKQNHTYCLYIYICFFSTVPQMKHIWFARLSPQLANFFSSNFCSKHFKVDFLCLGCHAHFLWETDRPHNTWPRFALTQPGPIKACFHISVYGVCDTTWEPFSASLKI